MPRRVDHGASETAHLTEQTFDEALMASPGLALGMVDAESVRKGEMARGHRIVHRNRDNDAGALRAEPGAPAVGDAEPGGITWRDAKRSIGVRLAPLGIPHDRICRE